MGWQTAWFSEIDPYASGVLARQFPGVPNLGDIRQINDPPPVDVLCGGFPCQDISIIGKGAGIGGERSGLWKDYARIIGEVRPRWIVVENSPELRRRGLDAVLRDLWSFGYDAAWDCIPARAAGAPHQRDRLWVVAHADSARLEGYTRYVEAWARREKPNGPTRAPSVRHREHTEGWWASEPDVDRVAHGIPSRVDRTTCLGNAIVPDVAFGIFSAIAATEQDNL
jgi:DNA (cytosine-5)-methyltransferase 1